MKRILVICLAIVGFIGLVGMVGFCWLIYSWEIEDTSFSYSHTYSLGLQGTVFVTGTNSGADFQGDSSNNYQIALRLPNRKQEIVTQGSRYTQEAPKPPFRLLKSKTRLYLTNEAEIYYRSIGGGQWSTWTFRDQSIAKYFGRAIMPGRYARNEKFSFNPDFAHPEERHRLPNPPLYTFERFGSSENIMVGRQWGEDYSNHLAVHTPSNLWPARLIYSNWQLDTKRTLALNQKKLRPFPNGVTMKLIKVRYPTGMNWRDKIRRSKNGIPFFNYELVEKLPKAQIVKRELIFLTTQYQPTTIAEKPEKIEVRGLCADPDSNLMHFLWKQGAKGDEQWAIAHKGERWELFEDGRGVAFARLDWK